MDKLTDLELSGVDVTYRATHLKTIYGARNSFGVSEEPDEEVYLYEVVGVSIHDVDIDLNKMTLCDSYKDEDEMMDDVSDELLVLLKAKLG